MARITTVTEIENICALGLDVWVAPPIGEISGAWCMKRPHLTRGPCGLMLGSPTVILNYLPKWGINDPDSMAMLYISPRTVSRLYNTQQQAQNAINRRLVG